MATSRCTNVGCAGTESMLSTQGSPAPSSVRDAAAIWMKVISSAGVKIALSSLISMSIGLRDAPTPKDPWHALNILAHGLRAIVTHSVTELCTGARFCVIWRLRNLASSSALRSPASSELDSTVSPLPTCFPVIDFSNSSPFSTSLSLLFCFRISLFSNSF